jgi:hypothetical protein
MKKFNLYTKIKHQRRKRINKIIHLTLDWCIDKWGINSDHEDILDIDIVYQKDYTNTDTRGSYNSEMNEIEVFVFNNENVRALVDTIIHEFTHQRQDMGDYWELNSTHGYVDNPLEIEAWATAKKYRKECWYSIRDLINL